MKIPPGDPAQPTTQIEQPGWQVRFEDWEGIRGQKDHGANHQWPVGCLLPASSECRALSGFRCHIRVLPGVSAVAMPSMCFTGSSECSIDVSDATTDARMRLASESRNNCQSRLRTCLPTAVQDVHPDHDQSQPTR